MKGYMDTPEPLTAVVEVSPVHCRGAELGALYRDFITQISAVLVQMGYSLRFETVENFADVMRKRAGVDSLRLAFHSFGKHGDRVLHYKEGYLRGYFYLEYGGFSAWSDACDDNALPTARVEDAVAEAYCARWARALESGTANKYAQAPRASEPEDLTDYVFVPLQTEEDVVAVHRWLNLEQLEQFIAGTTAGRSTKFVLKRHPKCRSSAVAEMLARLSRCEHVSIGEGPTPHYIRHAEAVLTANSGVGFEALILGVPVISTARSDYQAVTISCKNVPDLERVFSTKSWRSHERQRTCHFIYNFMHQYQVPVDDPKAIRQRLEQLLAEAPAGQQQPRLVDMQWEQQVERYRRCLARGDSDVLGMFSSADLLRHVGQRFLNRWLRRPYMRIKHVLMRGR